MSFIARKDVSLEAVFVAITDLNEMSNLDVVIFSGNRIVVENATSEINIFNINGQLIAKSNDESVEFVLPMGVYIVQIGNQTKRVVLK